MSALEKVGRSDLADFSDSDGQLTASSRRSDQYRRRSSVKREGMVTADYIYRPVPESGGRRGWGLDVGRAAGP